MLHDANVLAAPVKWRQSWSCRISSPGFYGRALEVLFLHQSEMRSREGLIFTLGVSKIFGATLSLGDIVEFR